jgi:isopropylmalate/homocitrate/citramalate synthase
MGGAVSICKPTGGELKCPKNYDKTKFQKILTLYDKLDTNGNMVIEQEEFYILANHHIKNQREMVVKEQVKNDTDIKSKMLMLNLKLENDKKALEETHKKEIERLKQKEKNDDDEYKKRLANIDLLTKEQKYEIFKQRFTDKENKINFKMFFEYMKTRTDDIQNINWVTSGKLNHLNPPKSLSVTINSPNARPRVSSP